MTTRRMIIAGLAVALAAPAVAHGTVTTTCTPNGVDVTWFGFRPGVHTVTIEAPGLLPRQTLRVSNGTVTSLAFPMVAPFTVVRLVESWGPGPRETAETTTPVRCVVLPPPPPPPVVDPPPPAPPAPPTPVPPPTPPVVEDSTPTPPATPVKPPTPRKPLTCAQLRARGAGTVTLRKRGCVVVKPRVCRAGWTRRAVRVGGTVYVTCIPPRRHVVAVTG